MKIKKVQSATDSILDTLRRLLPQLSPGSAPLDTQWLRKVLRQKNFVLLAAWEGNEIIGVASIYFEKLLTKETAWIEDVVVDETARGKGVGKALTEALIAAAKRRGVNEINLTSRPERIAANAMYQKLGLEKRDTNVYRLTLVKK